MNFFLCMVISMVFMSCSMGEYMNVNHLKKMKKEELIQMAIQKIKKDVLVSGDFGAIPRSFDIKNFDRIHVQYQGQWLWVSFRMSYGYVPMNSVFVYGIDEYLTHPSRGYKQMSNPDNYNADSVTCYIPTRESRTVFKFVWDAFEKSDDEPFGDRKENYTNPAKLSPFEWLVVFEKVGYYQVEVRHDNGSKEFYKVDRDSGKIHNASILDRHGYPSQVKEIK